MNQNELRDLLLSLAAEASIQYEKVLFDRNAKFDEITLITRKLEDLKEENKDSVFSPRSNLSAYDARVNLEKQCEKEREELSRLDCQCDSFLNRKEELLEAVELLDSIIEEREQYYKELQDIKQKELEGPSEKEHKEEMAAAQKESQPGEKEEVASNTAIASGTASNAITATGTSTTSNTATASNATNAFGTISASDASAKDSSEKDIPGRPDFLADDGEIKTTPSVKQLMDALSFVAYQCGEIADYTVRDPYRARNELRSICVKWGN